MKGRKSENSGFGIVVLDEKNQTLYKEGGTVRSDGNNFIPEIAAAAIVLSALPNHLYADIFIDSQATIAAIKEKPLSERRRIRSSGRAWKSFIRSGEWKDSTGPNPPHKSTRRSGEPVPTRK